MFARRSRTDIPTALTAGRPLGESHRQFALLGAFRRAETRRWLLSGIAAAVPVDGIAVAFALARPGVLLSLAGVLVGAVAYASVSIALATALRPKRLGRALDVYRWVGREDWMRFRRTTGSQLPRTAHEARRWLEAPHDGDDVLARIELLVWIGDYDAARRLVGGLPVVTSAERFEVELQRAFVEFVATGEDDLAAVRGAAAELTGTARDLADARVAVEAARHTAAAGGAADWIEPLDAARSQLGARLQGFAAVDIARWIARPLFAVGLLVSLVGFYVAGAFR